MIYVRTTDPTRVALWERDAAHPEGEILLSGATDQTHAVADTAGVRAAIRRGALIEVEPPAVPEPPEGEPDAPTASRRARKPKAGESDPAADPAAGVA